MKFHWSRSVTGAMASYIVLAITSVHAAPVTLENECLRVSVSPDTGLTSVLDKQANILWQMDPAQKAAGYLLIMNRNDYSWMKEVLAEEKGIGDFREELTITIGRGSGDDIIFKDAPETGNADGYNFVRLKAPIPKLRATNLTLEYRLADSAPDVDFLAHIDGPQKQLVKEVAFPTGFSVDPGEKGYLVVPHWVGLIVPNGLYEFDVNRRVYQGAGQEAYNMRFMGTVKETENEARSALVVPFESLYTKINMKSHEGRISSTARLFRVGRALDNWRKEYRFRYHFISGGSYVDIAKYYRQWSKEQGLFRSYKDKVAAYPAVADLLLPSGGGGGGFLFMNKDFHFQKLTDRVAELKAAGVKRANFLLYGWGGDYHRPPDVLPANEKYGGNEALIKLSKAIHEAGYDLTMNDIIIGSTEAAPSHSEQILARQENGAPYFCGNWGGSDGYIMNAQRQYKFVEEHFPKIVELFHPTRYYYDGQTNMPPVDDFSKDHPQTFDDDLYWRGKIFELTHQKVGVLSSESPNDWAVPYLDWTYDSRDGYDLDDGKRQDKLRGFITPLWYLVYHDALVAQQSWPQNYRTADLFERSVRSFLKSLRAGTFMVAPGGDGGSSQARFTAGPKTREKDGLRDWNALSTDQRKQLAEAVAQPFLRQVFYLPMTDHRFLSEDYFAEFTRFGEDVEVYVNGSDKPFVLSKETTLAPYGFLVRSRTHEAYAAEKVHGSRFQSPFLAVVTSMDGQPLEESREIRILLGFGKGDVPVKNKHQRATIDDGTEVKASRNGMFTIPAEPMRPVTVRFSPA